MPKLRHIDNTGSARFITFSCFHKYKLLNGKETIIPLLEELENSRIKYGFSILGYVIMPDHVHLVVYHPEEIPMGKIIGQIKSQSAYRIIQRWKTEGIQVLEKIKTGKGRIGQYAFWQLRCYDHNCHTLETVREKINYCHMNPVKAGLVTDPENWPWSSYSWYAGNKEGVVTVQEMPL